MFDPKIKLSKHVYDKARVAAEILGCTVEEFAAKALSTEAEKIIAATTSKDVSQNDVDDIAEKLKGLGYLD